MANVREEADKCISEAAKQSEGSVATSGDPIKLKCLQKYKEDLKSNVPKTQAMYDGYMQNFSAKDGSLTSAWKEKKEIAQIVLEQKQLASTNDII